VTVGNGNGTGGFGMGKAATPDLSIKRAFREAKRNLIFVERYKKSGLTRDLYGEHNNVKVRGWLCCCLREQCLSLLSLLV
jgi:ribosomal protein S5